MSDERTIVLPALTYEYDPWTDTLTVEGVRYAGALFREFGGLMMPGQTFRFINRDGGVVWVERLPEWKP